MRGNRYIGFWMMFMLLLGTMTTPAWAYKVTYHILALPMDHAKGTANTDEDYDGWRTEAIKVEVANASNIKLEEHFKSPLAKNFTYYPASVIEKDNTARKIYQYRTNNKYKLFKAPLAPYIKVTVSGGSVTNEEISNATAWGSAGEYQKTATSVANMEEQVAALEDGTYYFSFNDVCLHEEDLIPSNDYHVYVTYEYDADNTIAKLDGSEAYSIMMNEQFLAYNRGRNNRLAVIPNEYVSAEQLASEEFVYVDVSKVTTLKDKTYWQSSDNKNPAEVTKSKFHFLFKYIGEDPYNITIVSAYNSDEATYYIEKHGSETNFVKKLYRGSHLFAKTKDNASDEMLIASDVNIRYTQTNWSDPSSEVTYDDDATYKGYYHGLTNTEIIWNSFALVKAVNKSGDVVPGKLVYMGTRTTQSNGELKVPGTNFYYLGYDNPATIKIKSYARQDAPTIDYNMYEIRTIHFKVQTPFGNIVTDSIKMSEYTMGLKDIALTDIPDGLRRKYCSFKSEFYKDAAHTQPVTSYSELTEPYDIYVDYTATLPFKTVNPSTGAQDTTWYELTDEGSTEANGKKIKYDGTANFKNNGAAGSCDKTTEFAFVGDPYELRVLYRDATETAKADRYVGGTTNLDVSATASEDYRWEIPYDNAPNFPPNFLLRKMNNTGHWYWPTDQLSQSFSYATKAHAYSVPSGNAQTLTFTITNLTYSEGHYIKVTKGGTDAAQVISTVPALADGKGSVREDGTATLTVSIAANSESDKEFTLTIQEYNGSTNAAIGEPTVITVTQSAAAYGGQYITYSTTNATRIKLLELPKRTYTYKIVDKAGNIAVQATATQPIYASLALASLPANIISPYLVDETLTFFSTYSGGGRGNLSGQITQTPDEDATIYVKYTTTHLDDKPIKLSEDQEFNVKLNGQYIYYSSGEILTSAEIPDDPAQKRYYLWKLRNRDPYAMLVDNVGAREVLPDVEHKVAGQTETVTVYDDNGGTSTQSREKGAWVKLKSSVGNAVGLELQTDRSLAQRFVTKSSLSGGIYEVMVATGETVDASTAYYNMGRPTAENTVKIYDNEHYAHGSNVLAFNLDQSIVYTYHLIDKAKHLLLTIETKSADLVLPTEYQSPLVSTYKFYAPNNISIDNKGTASTSDDEYTPINAGTMIDNLAAEYTKESSNASAWEAADKTHQKPAEDETDVDMQARQLKLTGDFYFKTTASAYYHVNVTKAFHDTIYVTYDVNDRVKFNDAGSPYMLRFLDVDAIPMYYMEDGSDKLTTTQIKPIYPYCNGDGSLNIYGAAMQEEQFNGGSSTRPRWTWFFESDGDDPYHVKIHSSNTISYNGVGHPTYLETKAVHFNQDEEGVNHIVTCGSLPGIASTNPTEYMILGTDGHFKLLTTYPINETVVGGSADKDKRQYVISFEQYWKTYNMIKQCVLGIDVKNDPDYADDFSNDPTTWVVPTELRATLNTKLDEKGIGSGQWHSYEAIASAVRWNGYNDKGKANTKLVEKIEHWYQTFTMGDGTFDIESADIPPVLVLLDLHGWEIMRLPLGYNSSAALAALRAYDSPLVDKYYFYSNATKATGCHKYSLRLNDSGAERDQIKVNGKHYTSESLGELPPETATGVKSNGAFNDQFVTYTVKEEYAKSYQYNLVLNDVDSTVTSESGTASKFLVLLNSRFLRKIAGGKPGYFSKPIREASNPVGGNAYDVILDPCQVTVDKTSTSVDDNKDGIVDDINLWYVQPNLNIDDEMGIPWMRATGASTEAKAKYILKKQYQDKTGFDPYNIQLKNANTNELLTSPQDSDRLENGVFMGVYPSGEGSPGLTLATDDPSKYIDGEGYDHTTLQISNHTFMAVSDANGNMQLMPRFDNTKRVNLVNNSGDSFTTLEDSKDHSEASADNNSSMGPQTVFFVRSQVFEYHIIDNSGKESLRYKRAGDYFPAITDHFRSPLATDFTYYAGLADTAYTALSNEDEWNAAEPEFRRSLTREDLFEDAVNLLPYSGTYYYQISTLGSFSYKKAEVTKGLLEKQITGSFAEAGLNAGNCQVQVRYSYDVAHDGDRVLEGKWYTVQLAEKNLQATGTVEEAEGPSQGTGVNLYTGSKPATVDANEKVWQWKFLAAPTDPSSDYYVAPDPYDVQLFNRNANYTTNPTQQPSPMAAGIKVPNDNNGANHFALLSHDKDGGYALAVAGTGLYTYKFLNGASMTAPGEGAITADTVVEAGFTQKNGTFEGKGAQVLVNNDVQHNFEYKVINKALKAAVTATQATAEAEAHGFAPYLPDDAQTPLLNIEDYQYYGFAGRDRKDTPDDESDDTYSVIPQTILHTLYGLYDDTVYVTYKQYYMDSTVYRVPNKKDVVGGKVARHAESKDAALNIEGGLPYDIIWENDNMMRSNDNSNDDVTGDYIKGKAGQDLQADGTNGYVWKFMGNDPYALKIYNNMQKKYVHAASADNNAACILADDSTEFMLLKREGYEYGVLEMTGHKGSKLTMTNDGGSTLGVAKITTEDPKYFIIFGLSTHRLIYHLMIAKTCPDKDHPKAGEYIKIPYRTEKGGDLDSLTIFGTTQRDLSDDTYQLGSTIFGQSYSYDAGEVSIGDVLQVPDTFNRPNCIFFFYVDNIQNSGDAATYQKTASDESDMNTQVAELGTTGYYYFRIGASDYTYKRVHVTSVAPVSIVDCTDDDWSNVWQDNDELNNQYKGLEITKLMSEAGLIGGLVKINIGYAFQTGLETNAGEGFVTSLDQNLWYTYEAKHEDGTPYLAHYTNAWGLQAMEGRETRYTNDYLWSPLGDVYGFRMYNRYMIKNSGGVKNVMTMKTPLAENDTLLLAVPGTGSYTEGNEIFELLGSNTPGYFRIHPVINQAEPTYYIRKDPTDNYAKLSSTSYSEWTFNLNPELLAPYIERVNYVGGLKESSYLAHKTVLDNVLNGTATYADMLEVQGIVYNDDNIVSYEPGYYRLHNQPGVAGISPVRYASGYLHEIEKTGDGIVATDTVPMHFYSRAGVNTTFEGEGGLGTGFTKSYATRGDIPVPSTETDPSTIFYFNGTETLNGNPRSTMQTQGLYVAANTNGDAEQGTTTNKQQRAVMSEKSSDAITFSLMDIGGAVLLIHDGAEPATRRYLNYDQTKADSIYDLRFYHESPTDDAKWCMQPVQKEETAKMNEMPLMVATNNGGDDYYYTTFYAPFDVLLPEDRTGTNDTTYYAYICKKWYDEGVNPTPVPAAGGHAEGKFVPAATPVIIRTNDNSDYIQLTLPSAEPTESTLTCVLSGQYLEQKLGAGNVVYSMGVPFVSTVTMDSETGDITAEIAEKDNTNVGFYINANPNKELNTKESLWLRNNRYVLHNKAYYRGVTGPANAPEHKSNVQFVPVNFGDGEEEQQPDDSKQLFTGQTGVYDILGRKVASEAEVKDGSWRQRLAPGIYIVGGEKIYLGY